MGTKTSFEQQRGVLAGNILRRLSARKLTEAQLAEQTGAPQWAINAVLRILPRPWLRRWGHPGPHARWGLTKEGMDAVETIAAGNLP